MSKIKYNHDIIKLYRQMKLIESKSQWKSTNCTRLTIVTENGEGKIQVDLLESHEEYGNTAFIWDLYVQPEFRRKGVAKKLMSYALLRAHHYGKPTATLEWTGEDTDRSICEWYRSIGFYDKEFSQDYSLMIKELY